MSCSCLKAAVAGHTMLCALALLTGVKCGSALEAQQELTASEATRWQCHHCGSEPAWLSRVSRPLANALFCQSSFSRSYCCR